MNNNLVNVLKHDLEKIGDVGNCIESDIKRLVQIISIIIEDLDEGES